MIALVEGAKRQKTPNEIALDILLAALTIIFLLATATLLPFSLYSVEAAGQGTPVTVTVLVALLVCLIPTTIGALLSAIGIAGMDRMIQKNVIAMSGRAVEAAGDVDVLLLDKTGTITLGNRQATAFFPAAGRHRARPWPTPPSSPRWPTRRPEGRSIVVLAKEKYGIREREIEKLGATFVAFTAQTRMSGVNLNGRQVRKGAADAIEAHVGKLGGRCPAEVRAVGGHDRQGGRDAARGRRRRRRARGHPAQGHRQGRHPGALRRAAAHGHQDHHDHRRQPADRGRDQRGGGRGRLPGPGHARDQAQADPRPPGRRAAWWR